MESLSKIGQTLSKLVDAVATQNQLNIFLKVGFYSPSKIKGKHRQDYAYGKTEPISEIDARLITLRVPEEEHRKYKSSIFRTVEAAMVLSHELNHCLQYEVYYPSQSEIGKNLAVFHILENYIPEYFPKNAPDVYYRNPCEVQSELFGFKTLKYFFRQLRPDISEDELIQAQLDFVNQRQSINHGKWFFPKQFGRKYHSLERFLTDASERLEHSFHDRIPIPALNLSNTSAYLKRLNNPNYKDLRNTLLNESDGLVIASTLSDIVLDMNPTAKNKIFKSYDVELNHSLLYTVKNDLLKKIRTEAEKMSLPDTFNEKEF